MTFIQYVTSYILEKESDDLEGVQLIVPGKRMAHFFQDEFRKHINVGQFFPEFTSLQDWLEVQSDLAVPHPMRLQMECYLAYQKVCENEPEPFERFLKWSQVLLSDFNELEKSCVDTSAILNHLKAFSDVDKWADQLSEEELSDSELGKKQQEFWQLIEGLYLQFSEQLSEKKWTLNGKLFRHVSEKLKPKDKLPNRIYLVGFNALSKAEEALFDVLITKFGAKILWDIDQSMFDDQQQEAGQFIRQYAKKWETYLAKDFKWKQSFFDADQKKFTKYSLRGNIQQSEILSSIISQIDPKKYDKTALVLCDETALIPVLNRLPSELNTINVTMSYGLHQTPVLTFVQALFDYLNPNQNYRQLEGLEGLFNHPFLNFVDSTAFLSEAKTIGFWRESNEKWMDLLKTHHLESFSFLFPEKIDVNSILSIGFQLLNRIHKAQSKAIVFQNDYVFHLHQIWLQCMEMEKEFGLHFKEVSVLRQVVSTFVRQAALHFIGDPIGGLQIMGMLETRLLDFENLIFLGLNEGTMPKGQTNDSLIPFDLKRHYGMSTFLEKDAIYAYHFFRLLQRCKSAHFIYDTNVDKGGGQVSRFVSQIELEWTQNKAFTFDFETKKHQLSLETKPFAESYPKTNQAKAILKAKAARGLSASFLNDYFNCPVQFYKKRILKLNDNSFEEVISSADLGTAVHETLEELYTPFLNEILTVQHYKIIKKRLKPELDKAFSKLGSPLYLNAIENQMRKAVAEQMVWSALRIDEACVKDGNELIIKDLEKEISINFNHPKLKHKVKLNGNIDRIDSLNGELRIIDYKTGKVEDKDLSLRSVDSILDRSTKHQAKTFQVLFYVYLVSKSEYNIDENLKAGIISLVRASSGFIDLKNIKNPIDVMPDFEHVLAELILEILEEDLAFEHLLEAGDSCYYCV
ncbi:MAG: PD-(D/E)XK nuclease family protein [Flavobacteriales bacterium]